MASLLVAARPTGAATADGTAVMDDPTRDFVVYLGLDIVTELPGTPSPVEPDSDGYVRVVSKGESVRLSIEAAKLKTTMEPKLSRARASIEDLKEDRTHAPATDPQRDAIAQQMLMDDVRAHNQYVIETAALSAAASASGLERASAVPNAGTSQVEIDTAREQANVAANNMNTAIAAPTYRSALPGTVKDTETFETFEVIFRLATTEAYDRAYGVLRLPVRDPASPQQAGQTLKFFPLRALGPKPGKITVRLPGLPKGFVVDSYSVHIYAGGREPPTNLSSNRVDLTADEAHQFLILRHLQGNRHGSLPAQIIPELRPVGLPALIGGERLAATIELAIDHEGRMTKILPAGGIATVLSPELESAVREVRFLPALVNGNSVASHGTFALGELVP